MAPRLQSAPHSASAVLRTRCWPAHQRLESHPVAQQLMSGTLTPQQYAHVLSLWYQAWRPLEHLVVTHAPAEAPKAQWPARRSHLAEQDLTYLGYPAPPTDRPLAPLPDATGARWYGLAYVMQGSALGGQVIAAHLQRLLGLQAGLGASFFAVHVPATADHMAGGRSHRPRQDWTTWTQWLDQQLDSQQPSTEEAVSAAIATFDYLYDAFSCEPDPTTGV